MSANPVAKADIDNLVRAALQWHETAPFYYHSLLRGTVEVTRETADEVGQMLWSTNWHVTDEWEEPEFRYYPEEPAYTFQDEPGDTDPVFILKQISYYTYQTGDGSGIEWLASDPARFLEFLTAAAIRRLPGYDDAPWGTYEPPPG